MRGPISALASPAAPRRASQGPVGAIKRLRDGNGYLFDFFFKVNAKVAGETSRKVGIVTSLVFGLITTLAIRSHSNYLNF